MSRPVSWYRLFRGKVWHVGFAQDAAACGSVRPADAETVGERAPVNARVCGDCVTASLHRYSLAQAAQMADPRSDKGAKDIRPEVTPVADAYTLTDHWSDEWVCGNCGHPRFDHDLEDGTCSLVEPGADEQCLCRGLKRAG